MNRNEDEEYLDYWAHCVYNLGISPSEVDMLSYGEVAALNKKWKAHIRHQETMISRILLMLYNVNAGKGGAEYSVEDFLGFGNKAKKEEFDLQTADGQKAFLKHFRAQNKERMKNGK